MSTAGTRCESSECRANRKKQRRFLAGLWPAEIFAQRKNVGQQNVRYQPPGGAMFSAKQKTPQANNLCEPTTSANQRPPRAKDLVRCTGANAASEEPVSPLNRDKSGKIGHFQTFEV